MGKVKESEMFEYLGTEPNEEGVECHQYKYKFSTGNVDLDNVGDGKYLGMMDRDSIISLSVEYFRMALIKKVYNLKGDGYCDNPEDHYVLLKKLNPEFSETLEEVIEHWDDPIDDLFK